MLAARLDPTAVICEDDETCKEMARAALLAAGFRVVARVDTAMDAMHAAVIHRPDVLLLDLMLPWVSGEYAVSAIRQEVPNCTIVVYSSHDPSRALESGAAFAVPKGEVAELTALLCSLRHRAAS